MAELIKNGDRAGETAPWRDAELLEELYWGKNMDSYTIADKLGCGSNTIRRWMEKYGIERRGGGEAAVLERQRKPAPLYMNFAGYMRWHTQYEYEVDRIFVHQLLAIAMYGIEAVKTNVVHHENKIPWDNRPSNISIMSKSNPRSHHYNHPYNSEMDSNTCSKMRDLKKDGASTNELADKFSVNRKIVIKHIKGDCRH